MDHDNSILGLATIRTNRGITLGQIADATKISVRSLKAIEAGEFSKLPGGIYNTSYIRQYAKAIDFDESMLLDYYNSRMGIDTEKDQLQKQNGRSPFAGFRAVSTIVGS